MKTTKILFSILFLSSLTVSAQNNQSDNRVTSGGFDAGYISGTVGGSGSTIYGYQAGKSIYKTSNSNTFIGAQTGFSIVSGQGNTFLGFNSGYLNTGSGNVFLGRQAGYGETGSNLLYIDNSNTSTPLIWGDFANDQLRLNGRVGIGAVTSFPSVAGTVNVSSYRLFVTGGILTDEVRVNLSTNGTWADYVFNKDYNLKSLSEVEKFIKDNGHLPNVPSAAQVKEEGIELGNMAKIQQEKIEELTLYVIEQNKINEKQSKEIEELKKLVIELINKK